MLIVFALFCHFIEYYLALSVSCLDEILKNFFESVVLNFLKVDFFIDFCDSCEYLVKMLLFLLFRDLQFILNLFELFQNLRELDIFLIFKI